MRLLRAPVRAVRLLLAAVGGLVDAAFFLAGLTVWCAMHLALWSYAFDMGPAADCFGLPCPPFIAHRVLLACGTLAVLTFVVSRLLRKLSHNATSGVLLVLVTFDVAAMLLLGAGMLR